MSNSVTGEDMAQRPRPPLPKLIGECVRAVFQDVDDPPGNVRNDRLDSDCNEISISSVNLPS